MVDLFVRGNQFFYSNQRALPHRALLNEKELVYFGADRLGKLINLSHGENASSDHQAIPLRRLIPPTLLQ